MIHINSNFFRSKFSRRIFLIFVSSTVLPVLLIALISFNHVSKQLREQSHQQSQRVSKAIGMELHRSLLLASDELDDILRDLHTVKDPDSDETLQNTLAGLTRHTDISVIAASGEIIPLSGNTGNVSTLTEKQKQHLGLGKTVVRIRRNKNGNTDILMFRRLDPEYPLNGILFSKVADEPLLEAKVLLPNEARLVVLTPSRSVLFSRQDIPQSLISAISPQLDTAISGQFNWGYDDQEQLASYWEIFTDAAFELPYLVVVVSEDEASVLTPITGFRNTYAPTMLLAMLLVSFFVALQIRKKLSPLVRLRDATQRLANGEFSSRVELTSDDELAQLGDAFNSMAGKLGQQFTSLSTMADIDRLILSSFDADYIVTTVLKHAEKLTLCSSAAIFEFDEHKTGVGKLSVQSVENAGEVFEQYLQISSADILVLHDNPEYLLISPSESYLPFMETLVQQGTSRFLLLPLFIKQRLAAVIIFSYLDSHFISDDEKEQLRKFADHVAVALSNASWEEKLYHQAHYDSLTGLPNRVLLQDRLEQAIARAQRNKSHAAVILVDLDRFKLINDSMGHTEGDKLLKNIAGLLTNSVRSVDTVIRFGGDEFVIVIPDIDSTKNIVSELGLIADKILENTGNRIVLQNRKIHTGLSIGIAVYPEDGDTPDELVKNADAAMYHAKEQGRGRYKFYAPELNEDAMHRVAMEQELHQALQNEEFKLVYQPKVDCMSGRMIATEALIRWHHPERGLVPPDDFISIAEETGLISEIGEWVLWEACRQTREWLDAGLPQIRVAINVSPLQFREDDMASKVAIILQSFQLPAGAIELEVTEGAVMENTESSIRKLHDLHDMGIRLSIDDFGTGYSSLSYLGKLPIHALKVDQSFIMDMLEDKSSRAIVSSTIFLAHTLGLDVVAEGVETEAHKKILQEWHCDELQGYLFSKPLSVDRFAALLEASGRSTGTLARPGDSKTSTG
jgi:diguanylate cyclase (GGDEF)-like protein